MSGGGGGGGGGDGRGGLGHEGVEGGGRHRLMVEVRVTTRGVNGMQLLGLGRGIAAVTLSRWRGPMRQCAPATEASGELTRGHLALAVALDLLPALALRLLIYIKRTGGEKKN